MDFWNKRDLDSPPINSVKMRKNDSIIHMKSMIDDAWKILERKQMLHREAALLSRFIYKEKRRHRGHKIFTSLEKIHRGLKRYLSVNFENIYRRFADLFSFVDGTDESDEWVYVPTKQMLEHLLVQTQGLAKIMYHIDSLCQIAAYYCREQCRSGHVLTYVMISFGIISRIWYCSRYYIICACRWYTELLPYLQKMKVAGLSWLPEGYEFPSDLRAWLGPVLLTNELISCDVDVQQISEKILESEKKDLGIRITRGEYFQLQETRGQNSISNGGLARNGHMTKYNKLLMTVSETCDLGELVSRDQLDSSTFKDNVVDECARNVDSSVKHNGLLEGNLYTSLQSPSVIFNNEVSSTEYSADGPADFGENLHKKLFSQNTNLPVSPMKGRRLHSGEKSELYKERECPSKDNSLMRKHSVHLGKTKEISFIPVTRNEMLKDALPSTDVLSEISEINFVVPENDAQNIPHSTCGHKKHKKVKDKKAKRFKSDSTARSTLKTVYVCDETATAECDRDYSPLTRKKQTHQAKIHEIKSVHDLKVFLGMEKKARAKGKDCATSNLNKSKWKFLIGAVKKILKKTNIINTKGSRRGQNIAAMQEIRNCILSLIT